MQLDTEAEILLSSIGNYPNIAPKFAVKTGIPRRRQRFGNIFEDEGSV
jgi:hypothetical protein